MVSSFLESPKRSAGCTVSNFLTVTRDASNVSGSNFLESSSLSKDAVMSVLETSKDGSSFLQLPKDNVAVLLSASPQKPSPRGTGSGHQVLGMLGENSRDSLTGKFDVSRILLTFITASRTKKLD